MVITPTYVMNNPNSHHKINIREEGFPLQVPKQVQTWITVSEGEKNFQVKTNSKNKYIKSSNKTQCKLTEVYATPRAEKGL